MIHAKDEGEQWKEIKNLSMTCANIGQGPGPNESKVKQMLTETDRGRSQRAESSVIVAQSFISQQSPHRSACPSRQTNLDLL